MFLPATAPNIQCTHVPFHYIPMGGGCPPNHPIHSCSSSSQRRKQRPPNDHCELGASAANARETKRHCSRDSAQARGPKFDPWQDVCAQDPILSILPIVALGPLPALPALLPLSAHSPAGITQGSAAARFHPLSAAPLGSMKCQRKKVPMSSSPP